MGPSLPLPSDWTKLIYNDRITGASKSRRHNSRCVQTGGYGGGAPSTDCRRLESQCVSLSVDVMGQRPTLPQTPTPNNCRSTANSESSQQIPNSRATNAMMDELRTRLGKLLAFQIPASPTKSIISLNPAYVNGGSWLILRGVPRFLPFSFFLSPQSTI